MQPGQDYKACPACGQQALLAATHCGRCGHAYRRQFVPPNQTQAFIGGQPVNQTQAFNAGAPNQTQAFNQGGPGPNQTQAFNVGGPPANQTQAFHPGYAAYPRPNQQDGFSSFMLAIPPFVCFIIGFFTNLIAIGFLVVYFAYEPCKDSKRGWAVACGMISWVLLGVLWFLAHIGLLFFLSRHR